jgi:hypothetical protein
MAISGGVDLASQLYSNGGNWHAVDWSHVGGMAVIGGVSYGVSTVVAAAPLFSLSTPITQQVAGAYAGGFVQGLGIGISNGQTGLDLFGTATFSAGAGAVTAGVAGTIGNKLAGLRNGHYEPGGESIGEFPGVPNAADPSKRVPYEVHSSTPTPTQYGNKTIRIPDMVRPPAAEFSHRTFFRPSSLRSGWGTVYRAISKGELDDMLQNGIRPNPNGHGYQGGKLFAPTVREAIEFGKYNFGLDGVPNHIIQVRIPKDILINNAFYGPADGMRLIDIPAEFLQIRLSGYNVFDGYTPLILKR